MRKLFDLYEQNREKICHSFWFILIAAVGPFVGWYLNSPTIAYTSISALIIVITLMSTDFKLLLLPLPFGMTCFRELFYFDNIPPQVLTTLIIYGLAVIIMIIKNIIIKKKIEIKFNLISKSLYLFAIIAFVGAIVRHIFYNEPAVFERAGDFFTYPEVYNIKYAYFGALAILGCAVLSQIITIFNIDDYNYVFTNLLYVFGIFLLSQFIITFIQTGYNLDETLYINKGIGWCDKNTYCIAAQITLPFIAYIFSKSYKRIDALAVLGGLSLIILASNSRSAQITMFVTALFLLYIIVNKTKHVWRNYLIIIGIFAVLAITMYFTIPELQNSINRLFNSIFNGDSFTQIVTGRDVFWKWIIDYTYLDSRHILFGGTTSYLFELYKAFYPNYTNVAIWLCHNTFMTALALGGTLGLIGICYHIFESFASTLKRLGDFKWPVFTLLLFGLIHGLGDNTFFNVLFMMPYVFILSSYEKKFKEFI